MNKKVKVEVNQINPGETIKEVLIRKITKKIKRENFKILHAVKSPKENIYYCVIKYGEKK